MNGLDNIRACGGYIKPVMHHYDALPFWPIRKAMVGEYNIRIEIVSICVWGCHTFLLEVVDTSFPFWLFLFLEDKCNIGVEFGLLANVFGGSMACMARNTGSSRQCRVAFRFHAQGVSVGGGGWSRCAPGRAIVGGAYVRYNS
jgi:hypothetical protein